MPRRNIDKVVKMAAIEEMRQGLPRNEIKERYGVAASTLSRWAQEAGVEGPEPPTAVLRSRPLKKASSPIRDSSGATSSETRRKMLDNMLTLINDLVQGGGLKSHDVKNLGTAAKSISEAHQREQQLLREEQAKAAKEHGSRGPSGVPSFEWLVSNDAEKGWPRSMAATFAVLDLEVALEEDDLEAQENAKERVRRACVEAGLSAEAIPFDAMIAAAGKAYEQFIELHPQYQGEGLS